MSECHRLELDIIDVASPCEQPWNAMRGDDQIRFCDHCEKNVYNISTISREQAVHLIRRTEGNLCVRMMRRADGTLVTGDCSMLDTARRAGKAGLVAAVTLLSLLVTGGALFASHRAQGNRVANSSQNGPLQRLRDWAQPAPAPIMGFAQVPGPIVANPPNSAECAEDE